MDSKKVIQGLDIILHGCDEIQCEDCCFHIKEPAKPRRCGINEEQIQEDALELLKEQEPVEAEIEGGGSTWWHVCSECHGAIDLKDRFCRHCGRPMKWDSDGCGDKEGKHDGETDSV